MERGMDNSSRGRAGTAAEDEWEVEK